MRNIFIVKYLYIYIILYIYRIDVSIRMRDKTIRASIHYSQILFGKKYVYVQKIIHLFSYFYVN